MGRPGKTTVAVAVSIATAVALLGVSVWQDYEVFVNGAPWEPAVLAGTGSFAALGTAWCFASRAFSAAARSVRRRVNIFTTRVVQDDSVNVSGTVGVIQMDPAPINV
jgi:hypothetical protein